MNQQVSVEAALPVFRQRCGELNDENLLLKARVAELESLVEQLQQGNAGHQAGEPDPVPASSYLLDERT